MVSYTHPGEPKHVMAAYRTFLLSLKRRWMGNGRGHRCLRGHMKHRAYIEEYLAAKRLALNASPAIRWSECN